MEGPLELEQTRSGGRFTAAVRSIRPVPPLLWLLFSEGVNHLRAALDNVVWHMAEQHYGAIDTSAAPRVALPIHADQGRFERWCGRVSKACLDALVPGSTLGDRILALQPFVDTESAVPSSNEFVAQTQGVSVERAHALLLLQGYSNADKHRAIRVAVTRTSASRFDQPLLGQHLAFKELQVGDVLASGDWGQPVPMETSTAVMIARPEPFLALVAPAKELGRLHRYVADVAVPMLVLGLTAPGGLPPQVDLHDTGQTSSERLSSGTWPEALERLDEDTARLYVQALDKPWKFPSVLDQDDV